jgi:hypothetical protein
MGKIQLKQYGYGYVCILLLTNNENLKPMHKEHCIKRGADNEMTAEGYRDMHLRYIRVLCVHQPEPRVGGGVPLSLAL